MVPEFACARTRLRTAKEILAQLRLLERWSVFGTPKVVGAVAYDLVVAPDIDLECFCQAPMLKALTPETRVAILRLKTHVIQNEPVLCRSIDIYRAVIEGRVRTLSELVIWLGVHRPSGLIRWSPSMPG